jgi:hypothetical protein
VQRANAYLDAQLQQHRQDVQDTQQQARCVLDALCSAFNAFACAHAVTDNAYADADLQQQADAINSVTDVLLTCLQQQCTGLLQRVPSLQQYVLQQTQADVDASSNSADSSTPSVYTHADVLPAAVVDVQTAAGLA